MRLLPALFLILLAAPSAGDVLDGTYRFTLQATMSLSAPEGAGHGATDGISQSGQVVWRTEGLVLSQLACRPVAEEARVLPVSLLSDPTVGSQAAYGLGAEAFRRRGSDGDAFAGPLLAALETVRRLIMLNAIGNAVVPAALPALRAALANGQTAEAEAAVSALRRMPSSAMVDAMLLDALGDDRPTLRQSALTVIEGRGGAPLLRARIQEIAAASGDAARTARRVLGNWRDTPKRPEP